MATSGTFAFRPDVQEIITEAFERVGKDAQTLTGYQARTARRSLNILFAEWAVKGINLWTLVNTTQVLVESTGTYTLPVGTVEVLDPVIRRSGSDTELIRLSLEEWQTLPDKDAEGLPSSYFIDRQYTPILYLWPVPENSTDTFLYWNFMQMEDITSSSEDADVPYRWTAAMMAGLAFRLYEKEIEQDERRYLRLQAREIETFDDASADERDKANLVIVNSYRRG